MNCSICLKQNLKASEWRTEKLPQSASGHAGEIVVCIDCGERLQAPAINRQHAEEQKFHGGVEL